MQQEAAEGAQYVENSSAISHTRSHSEHSNDIEHDSYSDPIDLINARENAKLQAGEYFHSKQSSNASRDSLFHSDENYSNPVDSLRNAAITDSNHNASPPRPSKKHSSKQPRLVDRLLVIFFVYKQRSFYIPGQSRMKVLIIWINYFQTHRLPCRIIPFRHRQMNLKIFYRHI